MTASDRLHIGTSGWSYARWKNDVFYPPKLKQCDWLCFYAERFNTVEVNTSFYHLPKTSMIEGWKERAPGNFTFALKLWRRITHIKKLLNCAEDIQVFFQSANILQPTQRGPILVQLPPSWQINAERLQTFLADLRANMGDYPWKIAVEFRNRTWYVPEIYALLDREDVALCIHDWGNRAIDVPNDSKLLYIRRHGTTGRYDGLYGEEQIAADASRIAQWLQGGREVWAYYNNDIHGFAVQNARQLMEALAR